MIRAFLLFTLISAVLAQTPPEPPATLMTRENATGDWAGVRSDWEKKGFDIDLSATQFVQGVTSGGVDSGANGTGKLVTDFHIDLGKLAGWDYWSAHIKTETRYGGPILLSAGGIAPTNTQSIIPGVSGTVFSITSFNVSKLIPLNASKGDFVALSGGRYNVLDLYDSEHFFGGQGLDRFMNLSNVAPLTVIRQVPLVTNLFTVAWLKSNFPIFSIGFIDPNDHSTNPGVSDLFTDGVTFAPGLNLPVKQFGRTAVHSFSGTVTTKRLTPFSAIPQILFPDAPITPVQASRGSWSALYTFRQFFVERSTTDGWGLFSELGFADEATAPVTAFFTLGIGGNGLFERRKADEFGISYAYNNLSGVLKDNLSPLGFRRLLAEHSGEIFYNIHLTPWLRLTGDLQIIRPVRPAGDVAIVPGGRLQLRF